MMKSYSIAVDTSGMVYVTGDSQATWGSPVPSLSGSNYEPLWRSLFRSKKTISWGPDGARELLPELGHRSLGSIGDAGDQDRSRDLTERNRWIDRHPGRPKAGSG